MKPVKICVVSLNAYHLFNSAINTRFGGAEIQLYYLATELARDDKFDVNFIVGDFGQPDFEICQGVNLYKFNNSYKRIKYLRVIFGYLELLTVLNRMNSDIYIQRAAGLETGIISAYCRLFKKKFIYMVAHDEDVINKKPDWMPKGVVAWVRWQAFKLGLKNASLIIAQHNRQRDTLKNQYDKECIVRSSAHFIPEKTSMPDKQFILWVARCDDWKQPEIFLKLVLEFPEERFIMICPVSNDKNYFERIKKEAVKLVNLEFVEYVAFNEIDQYFNKAKVFVQTSKFEGFPNTFIQSAKNNTPIISLNVNPDGILEKYKIGFCAKDDFRKLIKQLKDLLADKVLWQKVAENIFKYAKENHDIKEIIKEDKKLLFEML